MGKGAKFQILESTENSDSESEDQLPLSTTILVAKPTRGRENGGEDGQGPSSGGRDPVQPEAFGVRPSNKETEQGNTLAGETGIRNDWERTNTEGAEPQETITEGIESQETEREPQQISVTGVRNGAGNNDLFPILAKIRPARWMKQARDVRAGSGPQ